jgi:hypothetical protein
MANNGSLPHDMRRLISFLLLFISFLLSKLLVHRVFPPGIISYYEKGQLDGATKIKNANLATVSVVKDQIKAKEGGEFRFQFKDADEEFEEPEDEAKPYSCDNRVVVRLVPTNPRKQGHPSFPFISSHFLVASHNILLHPRIASYRRIGGGLDEDWMMN